MRHPAKDPQCPACKATEPQLADISERLAKSGIPYFLLVFASDTESVRAYQSSSTLASTAKLFVWRTDQVQAPTPLVTMVVPSHLLVERSGVLIDKWPGTHRDADMRERMANQITSDALAHLKR